jgi:hypothetical protein
MMEGCGLPLFGIMFTTFGNAYHSSSGTLPREWMVRHGGIMGLEGNLDDLCKRGAYRAKPRTSRKRWPSTAIGLTTLEDKIVQRATTTVLNAIYETDFMGFFSDLDVVHTKCAQRGGHYAEGKLGA